MEIQRVLRPGGAIIIIESLGTGTEEPQEIDELKYYLEHLRKIGFEETWIRTDYQFESRQKAIELATFFFGKEMVEKIQFRERPILPECTGLWWIKTDKLKNVNPS
jgi:hypothetical protein